MRLVYRGNFQPGHPAPFSTESHIAGSLELLGHEVVRCQENEVGWAETIDLCRTADLFLWTSTHDYAHHWDQDEAHAAVATLNGILPTAAVHLDLFHGLSRAGQVTSEPWFKLSHCFTADGDHAAEWAAAGVNHHWLPPAVYGPECQPGTVRSEYVADVAFVGSWASYSHEEHWPARKAMLDFLTATYRRRVKFWPRGRAIRGQALNDLYASTRVTVGDSCLAATSRRYMSDRLFEGVGRGAFMLFPWIEAAAEMLNDGEHIRYFPPGDFAELRRLIDYYLDDNHADERERIRHEGQAFVRANHTYCDRLRVLLQTVGLAEEGPGADNTARGAATTCSEVMT